MIKAWSDEAWEDFEYWMTQDKKTMKKILKLLKDIDRNGYDGIGKPEPLTGDLAGYWSRRIDDCELPTTTWDSVKWFTRLSIQKGSVFWK